MAFYHAMATFNAGELSPKMLARPDVSQYAKGAQKLLNFLVTPYGAVERRPGTRFIAAAKYADKLVKLIRFAYSSEIGYLAEVGDFYIRFYREGVLVDEIASPYGEAALAGLKFVQSADVMFIASPLHPVHELKRVGAAEFTISEMAMAWPPVLDPNLDDAAWITPSGREGSITLTADTDIFAAGNVGGYWQLVHTRHENDLSKDFTSNTSSNSIEVFGFWSFTTHGTWTGTVKLQRSFDGGTTWADYRTYTSSNDSNVSTSGEEETENALYRILMEDYVASSTGTLKLCRAKFSNPDFVTYGVVKITAVTDARHAAATVVKKLGEAVKTKEWNEGAFSARRGFAHAISFYEERLILAGTTHAPNRIWGSRTNDWSNFRTGDGDDNGLDFTLASDTVNAISWLCQSDALVIGTIDSEWTISASSTEEALTPSNVRSRPRSVYGSSSIPAQKVGDVMLFVQRQGRKVREFVYAYEKEGYVAEDLTILADHITAGKIRDAALQQQPDNILWCVLGDGSLAALTYERSQEVCGWHRHRTDGEFLSIAVLSDDDSDDQIFVAVRRNGAVLIEHFAPREYGAIADAVFVDSAVTVTGEDLTEITGLDHLEGKEVQVLADGAEQTSKTVEDGTIALDQPAAKVTVGLPFESLLSPMPIELQMQTGMSLLRRKTVAELRCRVYGSVGGEIRAGAGDWQEFVSRKVDDEVNTAIPPKAEIVLATPAGGWEPATTIEVRQTSPLPLNVALIVAVCEVSE